MKKDKKEKKEKKEKKQSSLSSVKKEEKLIPETLPHTSPDTEPLAFAVSLIGGKWKLRVLWALSAKSGRRYGDIKRDVPDITDMMLSQSLRELTSDGLIKRTQFQEIPPRVEYALTSLGASLLPIIENLRDWAADLQKQAKR